MSTLHKLKKLNRKKDNDKTESESDEYEDEIVMLKNAVTHKDFWSTLIFNSQINDDLITNIDYGICKEEKDEGKNLRLETFNLLQILLKK